MDAIRRTPLLALFGAVRQLAVLLLAVALLTVPCGSAAAQTLTAPPGPVAPGALVTVTLTNDTEQGIAWADGCALRVLRSTGEYVADPYVFPQACDAFHALAPGETFELALVAPDEPGSYAIVFVYGQRAATWLHVSAVQADLPWLTFHPTGVDFPQTAHHVAFANPGLTTWEFANPGPLEVVLSPGHRLDVLAPGGGAVLATLDLAGVSIPAGKVTPITLPVEGLAPGPYSLEATYFDPGLSSATVARGGIQALGSRVDLHLPDGRLLPSRGKLGFHVGLTDFPSGAGQEPFCGVLIGIDTGSTPLAGGITVPLVADPLVVSSLGGLGGQLTNNIGIVPNLLPSGGFFGYAGTKTDAALSHPGIPAVSGLTVRAAALAFDPTLTVFGSSQGEDVLLL